ncbi:hypothetical protein GN956_G11817 [Arapaima gigas]
MNRSGKLGARRMEHRASNRGRVSRAALGRRGVRRLMREQPHADVLTQRPGFGGRELHSEGNTGQWWQ